MAEDRAIKDLTVAIKQGVAELHAIRLILERLETGRETEELFVEEPLDENAQRWLEELGLDSKFKMEESRPKSSNKTMGDPYADAS